MTENVDHRVRAWILTFPGLITASSRSEVLQKARAACGVDCSVEEFSAALNRSGYRPRQVRDEFRLTFPEASRIAPDHFGGASSGSGPFGLTTTGSVKARARRPRRWLAQREQPEFLLNLRSGYLNNPTPTLVFV